MVTEEELSKLRDLTKPGCLSGSALEAIRLLIEISARDRAPKELPLGVASRIPTPGSLYLDPDGGTWRMGSDLSWHRVTHG